MTKTVYFSTVSKTLKGILRTEKVIISNEFFDKLLRFLSGLCNYEEEGEKIKPNILILNNVDSALKSVTDKYFLKIYEDDIKASKFEKKMKSLIPFCKNGWYVYISLLGDVIEYGVCRSFSGPIGLTINQVLLEDDSSAASMPNLGILSIEVISSYEISIIGLRKSSLIIDSRLAETESLDIEKTYYDLASDVSSHFGEDEEIRSKVAKGFKKVFKTAYKKIHGTICLVVESDYSFPNDILSDGIWFKNPISLSDVMAETIGATSDIALSEKYYSLTGLLIEMLNTDGITIIDNKGYIRGYNVFINQSKIDTSGVVGGARKRAAYALKNCNDPKFIGVYFQSQDGYFSYERVIKNG